MANPIIECPYCGVGKPSNTYRRHVEGCIENDAITSAIVALMYRLSNDGVACPRTTYDMAARDENLPHSRRLLPKYGGWDEFCTHIDLQSAMDSNRVDYKLAMSEMRRISEEIHDGKIGPTASEWELYSGMPTIRSTIERHFGNWWLAVEEAGLIKADKEYYDLARMDRMSQYEYSDLGDEWGDVEGGRDAFIGENKLAAERQYTKSLETGFSTIPRWHVSYDPFTELYTAYSAWEIKAGWDAQYAS